MLQEQTATHDLTTIQAIAPILTVGVFTPTALNFSLGEVDLTNPPLQYAGTPEKMYDAGPYSVNACQAKQGATTQVACGTIFEDCSEII